MTAASVVRGHLYQGEDFLVVLFWNVGSVHFQIEELFWYFPLGVSKNVASFNGVEFDTRGFDKWLSCFGFFGLRWLLNYFLMLRQALYLIHAEFRVLLGFVFTLGHLYSVYSAMICLEFLELLRKK